VNELGFDAALNYKSPSFAADFRTATKSLIDVFFDNVGGEILDMALARAKPFARFVMCGGISQYNAAGGEVQGPKNYLMIVSMRIRMQGFIVFDYEKRYDEARRQLAQWLGEGKIKRQETVVKGGIERMPEALGMLYEGGNTGEILFLSLRALNLVLAAEEMMIADMSWNQQANYWLKSSRLHRKTARNCKSQDSSETTRTFT
jgi:NADPH-dependent curcumin reductase CurA